MTALTLRAPVTGANSTVVVPVPWGGRITITLEAPVSTSPTFGNWVRENRLKRNLSVRRLAQLAGVDEPHISVVERNRIVLPRLATRLKYHAAFGTSEADLVALGIVEAVS